MNQWDTIASFANICRAAKGAARNKKRVGGAARFLERLELEALELQRELTAGTWCPSQPTQFTIHDPKERVITAAPFRDRVVHHALVDPLEPVFDAALVEETFACRRGKGTHRALVHARELVKRERYFLKLDVQKCFDSIEHRVVLDTLAALNLELHVLNLCERVLGGVSGLLAAGLPIGNLTSQWFANLVLGRLDRFVQSELRPRGYVRYMDDFVLFDDKATLRAAHSRIAEFLRAELRLELKQRATLLAPTTQGLPFLGWRLHRGTMRVRPQNARRMRHRLRQRAWERRRGLISIEHLAAALRSAHAHLSFGDTLDLRRRMLGPIETELGSGSPAPPTA